MPALVVFGRRWRIGSDDLVFPGLIEVLIRAAWLVLVIVSFAEHLDNTDSCSKGSHLVHIFLTGVVVTLGINMMASAVLVVHSSRGTIMVTSPRRHVPKLIVLRAVFALPEIAWNILGTVWVFSDHVECNKQSSLWILLEALLIFTWVAIPFLLVSVVLLFEPMMRPERHANGDTSQSTYVVDSSPALGTHYIQLWEKRCRLLCCSYSKDENSAEAFRNVADVLASLFEESDLVASDVAAALVLLRIKRKYEETKEAETRRRCLEGDQLRRQFNLHPHRQMSHQEPSTPTPEWMTVSNAYHFMKFAMAAYGWPWYVYKRLFKASWSLRNHLQCCTCWRSSLCSESQDNCCLCNIAALQVITGLPLENIIYVSFHNKIYESPFFVAIDDETRNVVVSIRGTLSLQDAITDLNAQNMLLSDYGLPANSRAHTGVCNVALFVKRQIEETKSVTQALSLRQDYGLVITGHSLGAGAAVILSALLRPQYPDLRCFAYSPPGGLCSIEIVKAMQSFVMSVVVGNDVVPRLSISSLHDLRHKIITVLENCKMPKYRVLARGCWYMLFGISRSSVLSDGDSSSHDQLIPVAENSSTYESIEDIRIIFSDDDSTRNLPRHVDTLLLLPGRILYINPLNPVNGRTPSDVSWEWRWAELSEFTEIRISPNMLSHHLPQFVLSVLGEVAQQSLQLTPSIDS